MVVAGNRTEIPPLKMSTVCFENTFLSVIKIQFLKGAVINIILIGRPYEPADLFCSRGKGSRIEGDFSPTYTLCGKQRLLCLSLFILDTLLLRLILLHLVAV